MTEITNKIYYVGVNDRNKHRFEGLWPLPNGVSYNSYIIDDEKVALVDTVEVDFFTQFMENIHEVIGDREIDYLIINHMEPDHSGSIALIKKYYPNIKIVGNKKTLGNTITIKGHLMDLSTPQVMGILNVTPDSFYSGSRKQTEMEIAQRANQIIEEGGSIIDVGAFSTRPGADEVSEEEEGRRLKFALDIVRREQPDAAVSVDTYRPTLARKCIEEWGADIINDVSEGGITGIANVPLEQRQEEYPEMFRVVGELKVPYILMSVQPTLAKMMKGFAREVQQLRDLGAKDIILDPGFGFGKNLIQNYQIYDEMEKLNVLELPVLVGISRKSMIYRLLGGDATTSLNGTTVLDTIALMKGASILRVHDVKEAAEAVKIVEAMKEGRV